MGIEKPRYIAIFDTTLRDGEQTPGVSLTPDEKLQVARQLDKLGVDIIEAGTPIVSVGELKGMKMIAREGLKASICGLARSLKEDIDAVLDCDIGYIHTFIATSDLHMRYKLRMRREQVLRSAIESVEYAKSHGVTVEFSAEDATRSDRSFLKKIYKAVVEAGADRIDIPDTVGVMTPNQMEEIVADIKEAVNVPIAVHCHNDFGLATANSLAAVQAGASEVHVTVNGLGERAGNAALEEVVVGLHQLFQYTTGINTELITETSRLVSKLTGIMVQPNKAIVGENAFTHESGIHTHGIVSKPLTYEPIKPELVGARRKLVAGKHAGRHGIRAELEEVGIRPTDEQLKEIVAKVKEIGDRGKIVTDADLLAITRSVIGGVAKEQKIVDLVDLAVVTGIRVIPTASVKIVLDGKEYVAAETGVGPVDAVIKAIQKLTDNLVNVKLKEYRLEAITGGSDAVAEVIIKVEDKDRNIVSARAAREDIVMASVEAMIDGINKILLRKRTMETLRRQD